MLLAAAVAAGLLAVHGWSTRQTGPPPGQLGAGAASASPTTPAGGGPAGRPSGPGPLLASQSFASYAYRVWPGAPSAAARTAMTGLSISVSRAGSGLSVRAGVSGQPGTAHAYPGGARVYVVEASMGDEAGSSDYNLGDDGVVVTDAHGRILQ
ncbi:hypothetical protein [Nocardioides panaciterrulae]|uniref:Uncharacterized protein n=1 Tax=Nocardioides panaciterrulae TaxID=661492 RepID=A0A7Y9E8A0_9ACTN|nr:hypothetical protein [Nocardioides panaciterrulae]NYD42959.1 hypothetical protein [Nocardioides panaciterrulae]